ncbi:hypothetical protein TNCV_4882881 [Trichonephila clavipes]|nr:hypothetical protein TNCV_4882881 [Trichonephila clavipes]
MVITCSQLTYCPIFPVFRRIQPEKHLTVEIIRIMILLRLSRKRDEGPIVDEAPGPAGTCLKMSLEISLTTSEGILTSHCSATRGLLATDLEILNYDQVTRTTPELAFPPIS